MVFANLPYVCLGRIGPHAACEGTIKRMGNGETPNIFLAAGEKRGEKRSGTPFDTLSP